MVKLLWPLIWMLANIFTGKNHLLFFSALCQSPFFRKCDHEIPKLFHYLFPVSGFNDTLEQTRSSGILREGKINSKGQIQWNKVDGLDLPKDKKNDRLKSPIGKELHQRAGPEPSKDGGKVAALVKGDPSSCYFSP